MKGFSLLEVLIAMAISSMLLLGAARFLPALQSGILQQTQQQNMEEEIWLRLSMVAKHLQRAGYCGSDNCQGEPLVIGQQGQCVIVRWDVNSNGIWENTADERADSIGFRLHDSALETSRGAISCEGNGWEKITDPTTFTVTHFQVTRHAINGFPPELTLTMAASTRRGGEANMQYSVTGYNL